MHNRRLAAEGFEDFVESITLGLAQVLSSMTRAMSAATKAAMQDADNVGEGV